MTRKPKRSQSKSNESETERPEPSIEERERRYRTLFNSIDEGFCLIEILFDGAGKPRDYRFLECNPTFEKLTGLRNAVGRTALEMVPDLENRWIDNYGKVALTRKTIRFEEKSEPMNRWFEVFASPADDGTTCNVVLVFTDITERKRIEHALRKSEELFRLASDALNAVVYDWDIKSDHIQRSAELAKLIGFPPDDSNATNSWWVSRVHPDDRVRSVKVVRDAICSRASRFEDEYRMRHADGHYVWVIDRGIFVADAKGDVERCVGSVHDISDRREAEEQLRHSQQTFFNLIENAPFGVYLVDSQFCLAQVSASAQKVFSSVRPLIGRDFAEVLRIIWPEPFASEVIGRFQYTLESGESYHSADTTEERADIEDVESYDWQLKRITLPDGQFGVVCYFYDMTDRKRAELALRNSETRLRTAHERFILAQEAGKVGVWDWDAPTGATYWSESMWKIYGLEALAEGVDDGLWQSRLFPDDKKRVNAKIADLLASSATDYSDRFRIVVPDGGIKWLETNAKVIRTEDGRPFRMSGVNIDITDRVQAEGILDRYRLLSEQAKDIIWFFRPEDGRFVEVNRAGLEEYGYTRDEFLQMTLKSIRHPSTHAAIPAHIESANDGGIQYETIHVRSDGSALPVEVNACGGVFGSEHLILAIIRDITERKRAESQLQHSEKQLRLVTNSLPVLISYVDSSERYRFVNRTYSEWFGIPEGKIIGKRLRDIVGMRAFRTLKPKIEMALKGEASSFETWLQYKTAGNRYVHVRYVPDISTEESVRGFYVLVSDMTDLKRSQDLLRSSEERLGMLIESFTDYAVFSTDVEGVVNSWNTGAESIFGYFRDEIIGRPSKLLFTPEDVAADVPIHEMQAAKKDGGVRDERWHLRKDGTRFFASGVMMPLYIGKALTGYAKIAADLTKKQRHAEELQRAHDELEVRVLERTRELAASNTALRYEMAERITAENQRLELLRKLVTSQEDERRRIARDLHDQLGQRLTALRLKIASLRDVTAGNPEIANRVQRLQEITELLDSEVSFLAWELRPTVLDDLGLVQAINTFLTEWSRHYETPAEFHSSTWSKKPLSSEVETHLYRIAQEALNNIVKHAEARQVTVLLEERDDNIILIIEDDGIGFKVAEQVPVRKSGKGLGLIGMNERAALVGGNVEIESAPGKGTTIFARIPIAANGRAKNYGR